NTNNLGFVDSKNYSYESIPKKSYYAFVGDSFTVGAGGGGAWVASLRNNKLNAEVYNFGVAGTGFEHFYRLLHEMKNKVKITHIIIVAITDDFFRAFWHPLVNGDKIYFCEKQGLHSICQPIPIATIIPENASKSEIREISKIKFKEHRAKIDELNAVNNSQSKLCSLLYDESAIFYYLKLFFDSYNRLHQPTNIAYSIESIRRIRNEFPLAEINLIHLPQKYEVMTNNYSINIADQVTELGINYYPALEKCNWTRDMFFTRDAHPNKHGYENITKCVSEYLSF
ncbi:MAG: SGNH/GDSL hydrolase family protein, partial [Desulfuromonadales bacterium]